MGDSVGRGAVLAHVLAPGTHWVAYLGLLKKRTDAFFGDWASLSVRLVYACAGMCVVSSTGKSPVIC